MQKKLYEKSNSNQSAIVEKVVGKRLPFNIDAERAVIGFILLNDDNFSIVSEILTAQDFYVPAHQIIFKAILNLSHRQSRIDTVALSDELEKMTELENIGGLIYLLSLQEDVPALGLVEQHSKIIKEKSVLRELISSATKIITNCYSQNDREIESVLDDAEKTIFSIINKRSVHNFVQLNIWLKKTFQHLSDIKSHGKGITGIPSGYKKLDEMTSGFQNGDFVVLAASAIYG